jgi:hypothetical protein
MLGIAALAAVVAPQVQKVEAGQETPQGYVVLDPIQSGGLQIFPVVAAKSYPTAQFLTLDEGFRSGEVVVTEYGSAVGLVRRPSNPTVRQERAEVNRLVLINNSKRPLLLLAGEIVAGGKQDRVIGKDRIVPAESDPIDLSVFCVEPGRWVASSTQFNASAATYASAGSATGSAAKSAPPPTTLMAQPSVRSKAMASKDQGQVWAAVRQQQSAMSVEVTSSAPLTPDSPHGTMAAASPMPETSSYARVMEADAVKQKVDEVAAPIEQNYESVIAKLHDRKAVGVVVAVNGRIIWADIFASPDLLEKYWPKLVRSYASEAVVNRVKGSEATVREAQSFLSEMVGRKEVIESEPGIYRQSEVNGDGFKVFALTSLLPKTGFEVHIAKMSN